MKLDNLITSQMVGVLCHDGIVRFVDVESSRLLFEIGLPSLHTFPKLSHVHARRL